MDIRKVVEVICGQKLTQKEKRILRKMVSRSNRISREQQLFVNGEVSFKVLVEMIVAAVTSCPDINHISKDFFEFLKRIMAGRIDVSKRGNYISKHIGYAFEDFWLHDEKLSNDENVALKVIEEVTSNIGILPELFDDFMNAVLVLWDKMSNPGYSLLRAFVVLIEDSGAWSIDIDDIYELFFVTYDMSMDWGIFGEK